MTEKEFKKLKPGDKVQIVRKRVGGMNISGEMDKWLGKVMTVRRRWGNDSIQMEEDKHENAGGWIWWCNMIERKVSTDDTLINVIVCGNKTIAKRDKKVGIAKCDPRDKFDETAIYPPDEMCQPNMYRRRPHRGVDWRCERDEV